MGRKKQQQTVYQQAQTDANVFLLFGDSAKVSLLPTITRCWTRIGQQRVIPTPGRQAAKCWDWGALDVVTGKTVNAIHTRRNNVGFRRLLAAIARDYALGDHPERRVILFVDNDKAHKAKVVERLLAKHHHQIQVEFLAPYSPEYNPQEDVWQHMRRRVTHNHYFEAMSTLVAAVHDFHRELQSDPAQALRLTKKWVRLIST